MKKILAVLMIAVLMCAMLVSCDDAQTLIEEADAYLLENPYSVTLKMNFECDDQEINEVLSMMNIDVPMVVDGNNISMDMSLDVMGSPMKAEVVVYDNVMYYDMKVSGQTIKMKCELTEEQYKQFVSESNVSMPVNPTNFASLTVEEKDGKKHIACGEITEEGLKELNEMMKQSLESLGGEAEFKDITYGIILNDGKYESLEMTSTYSISIEGKSYTVGLKLGMDFEYGDFAKITPPENPDSYQNVNYSDLMG